MPQRTVFKKQFNKKTGVPFPSESGALLCETVGFGQKLHEISYIFLFSCAAIKYKVISEKGNDVMNNKDPYKVSRILYIAEAALEYFITLMVTEAYLAKVTTAIGMEDTLVAVLSAFVSLGRAFQLIAIFLAHKTPVKPWIIPLQILCQLFFALIYLIPVIRISYTMRILLFVVFLLGGNILSGIVQAPKTNWHMSLIDDKQRGNFTATMEIVSLVGGMIFTYVMGAVIDAKEAAGDINGAFVVIGITIFCLMLLQSATLIFCREKETPRRKVSVRGELAGMLRDKSLFCVIAVSFFWNIACYATVPFYGTYKIKELGFSMTFIAVITAVQSIVRAVASHPIGRYADRHGFARMLMIVFSIEAAALLSIAFSGPGNGQIMFLIYSVLHGIAMGGIESGEKTNLIYDYVDSDHRTMALALNNGIAGITGFLTTLLVTIPVKAIQQNGNTLFGIPVYAQQITSAFSFLVVIGILFYLFFVVRRLDKSTA